MAKSEATLIKMPGEDVLSLHDAHQTYDEFEQFKLQLKDLLRAGKLAEDCIGLTRTLGFIEPLTGRHVLPHTIKIEGPNWRESLLANGLSSRNRAVLRVMERIYGSMSNLQQQKIYLAEALTGFPAWLSNHLKQDSLVCSEYLEEAERKLENINHQDLCALSYPSHIFNLVICNELFEHVHDLDLAFREIARVLKPGGRLLATCPLAFGQVQSIIKARHHAESGAVELLADAEYHSDPLRPEHGSLVYRIPGWEILGQLLNAGFKRALIHHETSWKNAVIGSDLSGVLVIEGSV